MSRITISIDYEILVKARNIQGKAQSKTTTNVSLSDVFNYSVKMLSEKDLIDTISKEKEK